MSGNDISRRDIFVIAGGAGLAAAIPAAAQQTRVIPPQAPPAPVAGSDPALGSPRAERAPQPLLFFNEAEAAFVTAAIDLLIPADETWPGAVGCDVLTYIDRQLAGAYGAGARLYTQGPWRQGTPQQGYQLPYTPAELYRTALDGITAHFKETYGGRQLDQLNGAEQESFLKDLERGAVDIGAVPSAVFFETLLANTIEGFFADPVYGGNRDMAAWRMIGFPGAYAQYVTVVEYHGMRFDQPPISMAQGEHSHTGHSHGEPAHKQPGHTAPMTQPRPLHDTSHGGH